MRSDATPGNRGAGTFAPQELVAEGHVAMSAERLEETVFGVLDGVITSIALVVGVGLVLGVSEGINAHIAFLTVTAAALGGSLSMFVGAVLSARSRQNLIRRERAREEREVREIPEQERAEVRAIYESQGFTPEETEILVRRVTSDPKRWVDMMMRDELGFAPNEDPRPFAHGAVIGLAYLLGGILPALPFLLPRLAFHLGIAASLGVGGVELIAIGLFESRFSSVNPVRSAIEILGLGFGTALVVFLVTTLIELL